MRSVIEPRGALSTDWRRRLRLAIQRSGKKHSAIARDAEIAAASLSRILTGRVRGPNFETVARIAHAVGESVGWILDEPGYELSKPDRDTLRDAQKSIARALRPRARRSDR